MNATRGNAPGAPRIWRRQYLINPSFQWKYALVILPGVFLMSCLMSVLLFWVLFQQARTRMLFPGTASVWQNVSTFALAAVGFSVLTAVAFGLWSIIVTHRICGPLYVMEGCLKELAAGRLPTRRPLRKKDEFKNFYAMFWTAISALEARRRDELAALSRAFERALAASKDHRDDEGIQALVSQLECMRDEVARALGNEANNPAPMPTETPPACPDRQEDYAEATT